MSAQGIKGIIGNKGDIGIPGARGPPGKMVIFYNQFKFVNCYLRDQWEIRE